MDNQQAHPESEAKIPARENRRKGKCKDRSKDKGGIQRKPTEVKPPMQSLPGRRITAIGQAS